MAPRIEDYAIIGDGRSAALVSRGGSIDWLAWPRFDSASIFAALLDRGRGGRFAIAPVARGAVKRRYLGDTNVLETTFDVEGGRLVLTDLMTVAEEEERTRDLGAEHELLRRIVCTRGEVDVRVRFDPRPGYGAERPQLKDRGALGLRCEAGGHLLTLRAEGVRWTIGADGAATAVVRLRGGETLDFSLTFDTEGPAVLPPLGAGAEARLARSLRYWERWAARARYEGPHRHAVVRSALVVKLLQYAPSGALCAAPTTSLPERIGGDLNWDYRFCWLRDAAFSARSLLGLGYLEEAQAFCSWLLHSTRLSWPELRVLYDVFGRSLGRERTLDHLVGHAGSRPVRIQNGAAGQLQLDCYGEVIDAVAQILQGSGELDRETSRMLSGFGRYVVAHARDPDSGIWEPRGPRRHYTVSRVLCWAALDRLLEMHTRGQLPRLDADELRREREALRAEIETRYYDPRLDSYTEALGSERVDASLLLIPWYGFHRFDDPRMRDTWRRVKARLGAGPGLLYRNEQAIADGEGAFGICGFWMVEFLARGGGTLNEATDSMAAACRLGNDVGLYGEEIDPRTGSALGNFPQAYTHVGLINAAFSLTDRMRAEPRAPQRWHGVGVQQTAAEAWP